jgi:GalNAc-alpha-(1->4)-GalNAc-alpha-(1->3)-diNAcBac-PP-undecaprenol alpha-1,4-N-acetyl-D-galactosaminyltransferase
MKKNIFIVIPTLTIGGAERVAAELITHWCKYEEIKVHLVLYTDEPILFSIPKVTVHRLGFTPKGSKVRRIHEIPKMVYKIRQLAKKYKPIFVLSFMNKYNIFTIFSLFGLDQKIIVSERDSPTEKLSRIKVLLRNVAYRYAAGLIAQTESYAKYIVRHTKNLQIAVIYNPVRDITGTEKERQNIILFVGRLEPKKGVKYLIEALAQIKCQIGALGWRVAIVGDGSERKRLEKLVVDYNLEKIVHFEGQITNVEAWLLKAKIFAFPSLMEGFPNALAEAMVSGLACISFDCETGPSELIRNDVNGILVKVGDVGNLSQQILALAQDQEKINKLSTNAILIKKELDAKTISRKYYEFCQKASRAQ